MTLFSSKESYLGIDIGTASIKVVELAPWGGKPKLLTYGYADIVTDLVHSNSVETQNKIIKSLKKVLDISRVESNLAIAALPTFSVFNSIISLPPMSPKDLAAAVKWEAKKYVPMPLDEMILDWKVIKDTAESKSHIANLKAKGVKTKDNFSLFKFGKKDLKTEIPVKTKKTPRRLKGEEKKDIRVLVTAAPKGLVNKYLTIFKGAGLKLLSLETEAFALSRSLISNNQESTMIVDIGSITTDICIIESGVPILNRSIDVGGLTITKAISESLNINLERSEQFKRDFGVSINLDESQKGVNKIISTAISPIINEVKYVFDLYKSQRESGVEKIILAGGSAFLPNLTAYFEQLFDKPTIIGNPWDKIIYPEDLKPVLDEVGSRLAVAIGLAMRDIK